jgi:hypothetical protein
LVSWTEPMQDRSTPWVDMRNPVSHHTPTEIGIEKGGKE